MWTTSLSCIVSRRLFAGHQAENVCEWLTRFPGLDPGPGVILPATPESGAVWSMRLRMFCGTAGRRCKRLRERRDLWAGPGPHRRRLRLRREGGRLIWRDQSEVR